MLVDPCLTVIFTIDPSIIAAATTYILKDNQISFPNLDRNKIKPNDLDANCPALKVDINNDNDTAIDP